MPLGSRGHSGSSFAGLTAAPPPAPPPAPYPLQAGACHHLSHQSPARTRGHLTPSLKKRGLLVCTPTKGPAPLRSPPPPTCQLHGGGWRAREGRGGAGRAGATPVCTESDPYLPQAGQAAPTPGEGEDTGGRGAAWGHWVGTVEVRSLLPLRPGWGPHSSVVLVLNGLLGWERASGPCTRTDTRAGNSHAKGRKHTPWALWATQELCCIFFFLSLAFSMFCLQPFQDGRAGAPGWLSRLSVGHGFGSGHDLRVLG